MISALGPRAFLDIVPIISKIKLFRLWKAYGAKCFDPYPEFERLLKNTKELYRRTRKGRRISLRRPFCELAPAAGLEPATQRLTAACSTN